MLKNRTKYISKHNLLNDLNALQLAITDYENDLGKTTASEGVFMLTTMLQYAEKQVEKIKIVERAFTLAFNSQDFKGRDKDLEKFLTPQYYPLSTLTENLVFLYYFQAFLTINHNIVDWFYYWKITSFSKCILDYY